ncbi:MAG TPA: hypothetical protein VF008_13210 [Niastella sp.]
MNINRPLMPRFLKKAEQKLLLNKPGIWSTRTHLVLYYGVLFILFLATLCFLEPTDVRDYSISEIWIGFVSIISGIGFIVWLIYLFRFNVFKKYGNIHPLHTLGSFILYFIATGILVLFAYVHPVVESVRANLAYGDEEIVKDINAINIKIYQFEYDFLKANWDYDTIALVKDIKLAESSANYEADDQSSVIVKPWYKYDYVKLDSTDFNNRLTGADSTVKINDTVYLVYTTPTLHFVSVYDADKYTKEQILSSFELFNKVIGHLPTSGERETIAKELGVLLQKYHFSGYEKYDETPDPDNNDSPFTLVAKKYQLRNIDNSIEHIIDKKYRWARPHLPDYIRIFFYFTLGITLLLLIFRHSTIRTFFLTLLAGVLLSIFTAFVLAFSRVEESTIFIWLIAYTILFFAGSLITWSNKKRKAVTGIMINLFVFLVPIFPLLFIGYYYRSLSESYYVNQIPIDLSYIKKYFIYAEIGGILLFLILLATYIGKVYRRWYSLPEN